MIHWRVIEVTPLANYALHVRFIDGLEGEIELSELLLSPESHISHPLIDPKLFKKVYLEHGIITWPYNPDNDSIPPNIDIPPDEMYEVIKKDGKWVPKKESRRL